LKRDFGFLPEVEKDGQTEEGDNKKTVKEKSKRG